MQLIFKATIKSIATKTAEQGPALPTTTLAIAAVLDPLTFAGIYEHQTGEQILVTIEKIEPEGYQAPLMGPGPEAAPMPEPEGGVSLAPDPGLAPAGVPEAFSDAFTDEPQHDPGS